MSISSVVSQRQNPYAVVAPSTSAVSNMGSVTASQENSSTKNAVSTVTISPEAKRLFEQSQQTATSTNPPVDDLHDEAKYSVPEMKPGVLQRRQVD